MKYSIWLCEWLDNYIRPTSKAKTYTRYSEIVEQHIKPKLGDHELDDISPSLLQKFVTGLMSSGNLRTLHFILYKNKRYNVLSVEDIKGRGMYLEVLAKRVEASNG